MKDLSAKFSFIILILTILLASGCKRDHNTDSDFTDEFTRVVSDSIRESRFEASSAMIAKEKKEAVEKGDSLRWANAMVSQAIEAYYRCDPPQISSSTDSALNWLMRNQETRKAKLLIYKALQCRGSYYSQFAFQPDSAISYLKRGLDFARAADSKEYAIACGNLADAYKLSSRLDSASDFYHKAIYIADSISMPKESYISLYGGLASVYTGMHDFSHSKIWWDKTMELFPLMTPFEKFNNLNNLGNDYYYQNDFRKALGVFKRLSAYLDSIPGSEWEQNFCNVNLSDCYLNLNMTDSASPLISSTLDYFTHSQPNPAAQSYLHTLQMREAFSRGNLAEAERLIDLHPEADTIRPEQLLARLKFLKEYYAATGNYKKAYTYLGKFETLNDSLRSEDVKQSISAQQLSYDRDRSLFQLRLENQTKQSHILRLAIILTAVVSILLLVLAGMLVLRHRWQKREDRMLRKIIEQQAENFRARITPHFIYNALNHELLALKSGAGSNLKSIVSLLRHQQYLASEIMVPLQTELDFIDDYIIVESSGMNENSFSYTKSIEEWIDPMTLMIPSMSLQILVENAFKHAFSKIGPDGEKLLDITARIDGDMAVISVSNNLPEAKSEEKPETGRPSSGLRIITETFHLINLKCNASLRFTIDYDARIGNNSPAHRASIFIPLHCDYSRLKPRKKRKSLLAQ